MIKLIIRNRRLSILPLLIAVLSACGSGPATTPTPSVTATLFPTYIFVQPTEASVVVTAGLETATAAGTTALDPDKVALGKSRYEALDCGSCHGDKGQGTDKGSAIAGTKLTEDQFVSYLRTGGTVGNSHLYSTNRLSDSGSKNLYVYVLSLSTGSK